MTQELPESCNLSHRLIDSFAVLIVPFFLAETENSFPCLDGSFIILSDLMDLCHGEISVRIAGGRAAACPDRS